MRIQKQTSAQMILAGIPGSMGWMLILTFCGLLLMTIAVLMSFKVLNDSMSPFLLFPLGLGALFGIGFIWIGISQLRERERLILDKTKRIGTYITTTPYLFTEESIEFEWEHMECIEISNRPFTPNDSPSQDQYGEEENHRQVTLILRDPVRSIVIKTAPNDDTDLLSQIAQKVSSFLDIKMKSVEP
jgi:hypothetical protein